MSDGRIAAPDFEGDETLEYRTFARPKRMFHTVLDAARILPAGKTFHTTVTTRSRREEGESFVEVSSVQGFEGGSVHEVLKLNGRGRLQAIDFHREMRSTQGLTVRDERADFAAGVYPLPEDSYPEVCLPFLLRWQPLDGTRRSVHAWIADRFVARVYYEAHRPHSIEVPAGRFEAREVVMYPDLNDWVRMPRLLADLSKPFLPKYHMHFEAKAPHRLVRFEGPHGPPGAPEIVFELLRSE